MGTRHGRRRSAPASPMSRACRSSRRARPSRPSDEDPNFVRVAQRLGREHAALRNAPARERSLPHHLPPRRRQGQSARRRCDRRRRALRASGPRRRQRRERPAAAPRRAAHAHAVGAGYGRPSRSATSRRSASCSDTTSAKASTKALGILEKLADEKPNSRRSSRPRSRRAYLAMFDLTSERDVGRPGRSPRAMRRGSSTRGLPEVDITLGQRFLATGQAKEAVAGVPPRPRRAARQRRGPARPRRAPSTPAGDPGRGRSSIPPCDRAPALLRGLQSARRVGTTHFGRLGGGGGRCSARRRELAPDSDRALSNLGGAETMRCNFPAALAASEGARARRRSDPSALVQPRHDPALDRARRPKPSLRSSGPRAEAPNDFMIRGNLGDAYRARGDAAKADACLRAFRSPSPARSSASTPRTRWPAPTWPRGSRRPATSAEASHEMGRVIALDPKEPDLFSDAAIVAALAGRDAEALAWLRRAVAAGYCREIIASAARVRPLPRQPGISLDRRRAAQCGRLFEGGDHANGSSRFIAPPFVLLVCRVERMSSSRASMTAVSTGAPSSESGKDGERSVNRGRSRSEAIVKTWPFWVADQRDKTFHRIQERTTRSNDGSEGERTLTRLTARGWSLFLARHQGTARQDTSTRS